MFALAKQSAHMGAEELVAGADEEITIERADINEVVGGLVNRVDVCQRANGMSKANDVGNIIDGPNQI